MITVQVSSKLRRGAAAHYHWCPACEEMHALPDKWKFNGNLESPTFTPSFKHSGMWQVRVAGKWTGAWVRDGAGKPVPFVCHYVLTDGVLSFCDDCSHALRDKSVPLPVLPEEFRD